jgi:hypothetical protein
MLRNVVDGLAERLQYARRAEVCGIEGTKQVGQFRQRDSRMINDSRLEELVDLDRRPALEHVDIDARIQQQFSSCRRLPADEWKIGVSAPCQRRTAPLGLDTPNGRPAVKPQA